jgi:hypothetical protein
MMTAFVPFSAVRALAQSKAEVEENVRVAGHLALPRMHVNQMFLQQRGERYFLYLHRPTKQAFALVDVTKPEKPALLDRATLQQTSGGRVEMAPSEAELAVAVAPESPDAASQKPAAEVKLPTETIRLIDLSDPKKPRTIKTFTGVTSMLPDDARHLMYIVNSEGLWVVSHRESHVIPYCTTSSAMMIEPNCQ